MWELDYKESWAPKNWCFWTVVLEKTLESPLDFKEIQPTHPKGNQSWYSLEGLMLRVKLQYFGHLMWRVNLLKRLWCWEGLGAGGESEWTPGVGDGQGGLACCGSWSHKESDTTERLNWTELMIYRLKFIFALLLFSHSVMSDSLGPHGLQHSRLPCPSPYPRVCSNSCPSSWWCHPTILSSVIPFSSCLQSFPASGSFPVSWLFASSG